MFEVSVSQSKFNCMSFGDLRLRLAQTEKNSRTGQGVAALALFSQC